MSHSFGLIRKGSNVPVPLLGVTIKGRIVDFGAEIEVEQLYENAEDFPIEATYLFPISELCVVCGFKVVIDGKVIVAKVKTKEKAQDIYDNAISSGHGAYLAESKSPDVFQISVGNLPSNKRVNLTLNLVLQLRVRNEKERNFIQLILPTTVAPSYALSPSTSKFSTSNLLSMKFDLQMSSPIINVTCSHFINFTAQQNIGTIQIDQYFLQQDLNLDIEVQHQIEPNIQTEILDVKLLTTTDSPPKDPSYVSMITFFPKFQFKTISSEIVIIIDRSGSMSGAPLKAVETTLRNIIQILPNTTIFNIVSFGTEYTSLFKESVPANSSNKSIALEFCPTIHATMGGTNLYNPLKFILSTKVRTNFARQLFLLTDGEVENSNDCINCVRQNAETTRCFTFGIGNSVSVPLVKGIAQAGFGEAEFISTAQGLESVVMRQVHRALQPSLTNVMLKWTSSSPDRVSPVLLPPIFSNESYVIYAVFNKTKPPITMSCTLSGITPEGSTQEFPMQVVLSNAISGVLLHRLAGRSLLQDYENPQIKQQLGEGTVKKEIIQLSTTMGLTSQYTSFVAVENRDTPVELPMQSRPVSQIRQDIDQVRSIMTQSIDRLVERGERIENLVMASETLEFPSQTFKKRSSKLRRRSCLKQWLFAICCACVISLFIILLLVFLLKKK